MNLDMRTLLVAAKLRGYDVLAEVRKRDATWLAVDLDGSLWAYSHQPSCIARVSTWTCEDEELTYNSKKRTSPLGTTLFEILGENREEHPLEIENWRELSMEVPS